MRLSHASVNNYDRDAMIELFRTLEFRSLVNKLPEPHSDARRSRDVRR